MNNLEVQLTLNTLDELIIIIIYCICINQIRKLLNDHSFGHDEDPVNG